jgi:hypothetical protein
MEHLSSLVTKSGHLLLTGDFNIHMNNEDSPDTIQFLDIFDTFDLHQHIHQPTHNSGNIIDLLITKSIDNAVLFDCKISDCVSDHFAVNCKLLYSTQHKPLTTMNVRKFKKINTESFCDDLKQQLEFTDFLPLDDINLDETITKIDAICSKVIDNHAPLTKINIANKTPVPWFSDDLSKLKRSKRKAELNWRKCTDIHTKNSLHKVFTQVRNKLNYAIKRSKSEYYNNYISENSSNHKLVFKTISKLLSSTPASVVLNHTADIFNNFFINKIQLIRTNLDTEYDNEPANSTNLDAVIVADLGHDNLPNLNCFSEITDSELSVSFSRINKHSFLDILPYFLFKLCFNALKSHYLLLFNHSFISGIFPSSFKTACVIPLIKKSNLDHQVLNNFRPISTLRMDCKILERLAFERLSTHFANFTELFKFQSAYRPNHSTESALLNVQNAIQRASDRSEVSYLLLLDLSAAFDTLDHSILLDRLSTVFRIRGAALNWISSYLTDRQQFVKFNGATSCNHNLRYGVPQGSVLGPLLFISYLVPLASIFQKFGMSFHIYADDTQLYIHTTIGSSANKLSLVENCFSEVNVWMLSNKLKLNSNKTEFIVIYPNLSFFTKVSNKIKLCDTEVVASNYVKNLGVIFDSKNLCKRRHVNQICSTGYYYLRNLRYLKSCLTYVSLKAALHAFVFSRLDYCNSLLTGIPDFLIRKLDVLQHSCARLLTNTPVRDSISPVMYDLHWLPVKYRIIFKCMCFVYKFFNGLSPMYFNDMLKPLCNSRICSRNLRSSDDTLLLYVPRSKKVRSGDCSFSVFAPKNWNVIPYNIRSSSSFHNFTNKLKSFYFGRAYT